MKTLADSISNYQNVKQTENYIDASNDKRLAYDDAVNSANEILNQTHNPTMSSDVVNQKAQKVQQTKDALDGQQRLAEAKEHAINHLSDLHDLNNAQRQALTDQINHSDNITSVNHIKDNANVVNTAMTGLKQSVADNNSEIQQGNYINADKDKQDAYNSAVNQAKQIINESNKNNVQLNPSEISKITEKVNSTKMI